MSHLYQRQVQFADTDAAGVVHFSRLLCFVEEAEHNLLSSLEIPIAEDGGWPRVHISCDYLKPLRFPGSAQIMIQPVKLGESSINWSFEVESNNVSVARGEMTTVCVDDQGKKVMIPQHRLEKLEAYLK